MHNLRIIQEYFQPKIGRKIRSFSQGWKTTFLYRKKECNGKMAGVNSSYSYYKTFKNAR